MERVLLVDGNNLIMRSIHACNRRVELSNEDGINTGPLLVFINLMSRYVRELRPDRLVVCWDGGHAPWRLALYDGYKGNRNTHPDHDDHEGHFDLAKTFLTLAGIHHVCVQNVEADDLIAHYWHKRSSEDEIVILSGDKDFFQLIDHRTSQVQPGVDVIWTVENVEQKIGCKPEHFGYVKALMGDMGDGVPGIPRFGEKTACKALAQHDWDMNALLATEDPKWQRMLQGSIDDVRRNYMLLSLRIEPPNIELEPVPRFDPTSAIGLLWRDLLAFLRRYQLRTVEDRLRDERLWRDV